MHECTHLRSHLRPLRTLSSLRLNVYNVDITLVSHLAILLALHILIIEPTLIDSI